MSSYLDDIILELRREQAKYSLFSPKDPEVCAVEDLLSAFQEDVKQLSCNDRKELNNCGFVCDGGSNDDELLASKPLCWTFITELFHKLVNLAEELYWPYFDKTGESKKLITVLHTRVTQDPILLAKTEFPEESDSLKHRVATITLDLPVTSFNSVSLQQMAYFMFHEIFVHCPEGWDADGRRAVLASGVCFARDL